MPEAEAVEVPEELDPAEVVSLVLTYVTAYQLLHRMARAQSGETVLVHGAAGRVGTAVLELGALAGLRLFGTASARDRAAVERLGAVAIDYRNEDFLARVRELTGDGVDVVLDGLGGVMSLRSFRALRPGGRLVVYGHYATLAHGRKSWRGWIEWYATTAAVALCGLLSPRRRVLTYRIQKLRDSRQWLPVAGRRPARPVGGGPRNPEWFREDFSALLELLREDKIHPVVAERLPLSDARRAHELLERSAATGKTRARAMNPTRTIDWSCCPHFDSPSVFAGRSRELSVGSEPQRQCAEESRRLLHMRYVACVIDHMQRPLEPRTCPFGKGQWRHSVAPAPDQCGGHGDALKVAVWDLLRPH